MTNFLDFFKKPIVWIYISVIYIWLFAISILVATLGPTFVVAKIADNDNSISFTELKTAFLTYIQEAAKMLNYDYNYVLYSYISNVLIYTPALIIGFFVLRKKMWAMNIFIALIITYLLQPVVISALTSGLSFNILSLNTIIYSGMIYLLTRRSSKAIFTN